MKLLLVPLMTLSGLAAQTPADPPKFEVASVKRAAQCFSGARSIDPASVTLQGVPLKAVLVEGFQVKMDQIEGPSWLETDCVDISAKIPEGVNRNQLPVMLRALLAERFRLTAHKEDRPRSGYALVVDKGGAKFKEDDPKTKFMERPGLMFYGAPGHGRLKGVMTMATLARNISNKELGPIEDLTGLTGRYDIDLSWAPDPGLQATPAATADTPAEPQADLPTALRDSLGLKLERRTVHVEFVVVDHIERIPTEN